MSLFGRQRPRWRRASAPASAPGGRRGGRRRWSLHQRSYALLIVASVLPPLLVTALLLEHERTVTREAKAAVLTARADEVGHALELVHQTYVGVARRTARDPLIVEYCQRDPAARARQLSRMRDHLAPLLSDQRAVRGVGVLDRSGTVIAAAELALVGTNVAYRDYFRTAVGGDETISDPYLSVPATGRTPTMAYAVPVRTADRSIVGVFVLWLDMRFLWDIMRDGNDRVGPGSFFVLLDRHGIRIGHSANDGLLFHPSEPVPPRAAAAMRAGRRFQERTEELLGGVVPFPFDEVRGTETKIFRRLSPTNHVWNLAVSRHFPALGWTLVTLIPESAVEVSLGSLLPHFASAGLAGLALSLLGGAVFMRHLVRPVLRLAAATAAMERGSFDARRTDRLVEADFGGAVGELARSFRSMASALAERDRNLRERNDELEEAVDSLRRTQAELLQAQKLEAVGRLAAGIAHEINTPMQYIGDNARFLEEAFEGLASLVRLQRDAIEASATAEARQELALAGERVDLGYLLEQAPKSIARTLEGVQRVATIVRAMKEFAHPDQKEKVATDLNRALLATLEVARNEYKYIANVETELGDLPLVTCHAGDLNQVFLNIVVNAAHAIEDVVKGTQEKGTIRVETRRDGDTVVVVISDTGGGIPDAIRDKVFDPFFTTKPVGRGTGQGLAIARSIVLQHKGTLGFEGRPGGGTVFHIRIPIQPPA